MTQIKTAEEYREQARQARAERQRSIDESDTDGFLSQWASGETARTADYNASIVEQGYATAWVLMDLHDKIVATRQIDGVYGPSFVLEDEAVARGLPRFISESSAKNEKTRVANNARKGVKTAWVKTTEMVVDRRGTVVAAYTALLEGNYEVLGYTRWIDDEEETA